MAFSFKKFWNGIKIKGKTASTSDSLGDIEVSSSTNKISFHNGTTNSPMVTEAHAASLTNKAIDADSNTITNIENADIKAAAAIDATKIANGSVSSTEFQYLDGVTSAIQTQLNGKIGTALTSAHIYVGNGSNVATDVAVSGDVTTDNTGNFQIASGVIVNADINASAAIDATKIANGTVDNTEFQYLGNVTSDIQTQLNAKAATSALTAHTGSNSGVHGVTGNVVGTSDTQILTNKTIDGDDNTVQDLALSSLKTVLADASKFIVRDASGAVISNKAVPTGVVVGTTDTQVLTNKDIDGGTASNTSRITLPKATKSTLDALTRKEGTIVYGTDTVKPYIDTGSILKPIGSGSGGNVNFMNLTSTWSPDNTDNVDAEVSVGSWVAFADAAAATPVDLTGGSPTVTIARTTTAGEVLDGTASFKVVKDAANRQGEGASCTFNIPPAYQGKLCSINIPYKISSGSISTGDLGIYVYDVTNSALITPIANGVSGTQGTVVCFFTATASAGTPANQQYRVGFYFQTTSTTAVTFEFDDVQIGPQTTVYSPSISDWQIYTPTLTGVGTTTNVAGRYRQVGSNYEIRVTFTAGTPTATLFSMTLPNGASLDTTSTGIQINNTTSNPGTRVGEITASGASQYTTSIVTATGTDATKLYLGGLINNPVQLTPQNGSTEIDVGAVVSIKVSVPIAGLASKTPAIIVSPNIGPWQSYTPTFTGFGTPTAVNFIWRQVGQDLEIKGSFTGGTTTATEARITLPAGFTSVSSIPTLSTAGYFGTDQASATGHGGPVLIEPSVTYMTFGDSGTLGSGAAATLAKANGSSALTTGAKMTFNASILVQGLSANAIVNSDVSARYFASATSISGTLATVNWTTQDFDVRGAVSSGVFTVPASASGKYQVNANILVAATFTLNNTVIIEIQKNGTVVSRNTVRAAAAVTNLSAPIADIVNAVENDTIRIQVSSSGTGPTIAASNFDNYMSIAKLPG